MEEKSRSEAVSQLELEKFDYNAQTYFFGEFASHVHAQMPTSSFGSHFAEAYIKKFRILEEAFAASYESRPTEELLQGLLRKLVFENWVGYKDPELLKLSQYYIAHVLPLRLSAAIWPCSTGRTCCSTR
jgi:exonuclease V gamma subunit